MSNLFITQHLRHVEYGCTATGIDGDKIANRQPYNVNFFCHVQPVPSPEREAVWRAALEPYYREYEIDICTVSPGAGRVPFSRETAELLSAFKPPIVSFHFGLPAAGLIRHVRGRGTKILSSATTVEGAIWLDRQGVDAVLVPAAAYRSCLM